MQQLLVRAALVLALACLPCLATAQAGIDSFLVKHVVILDASTNSGEVAVNLVVKDGKLELITQDDVPGDSVDVVFDADGRVVIGTLTPGERASFVVLDEDPREKPRVLMDTRTYTRFAILDGEIQRNRLLAEFDASEKKPLPSIGRLAYTPPPLAVPANYFNTTKWNRFDSRWVSGIAAGAVLLDRMRWTDQDAVSKAQVGDLEEFSGGEIRGLRFGAAGTLNFERPWVWTLFGATHAFDKGFDQRQTDSFTLFDVRLDVPAFSQGTLSIGKQKEPISMQRLMSLIDQPMQERSAPSDAFFVNRNTGLVMSVRLADNDVTLAGGVFNDFLDKDQPNSISANSTQLVGRGTWVPWESDDNNTLVHLGAGYRYTTAREGLRFATEPEFNQSPLFVDTGVFDADRGDLGQVEASVRSGPFWVHGEYYHNRVETPGSEQSTFTGYDLSAAWNLTGEVRPYRRQSGVFGRIPVARTVQQNGWGAWELAVRYSQMDLNDGAFTGGEMDILSAGVNWMLNPYTHLNLNYRYVDLLQYGERGASQGVNVRLVLLLE